MKWELFIEEARKTILDSCKNFEYLFLGLSSELGEVEGKLKKKIRGDFDLKDDLFKNGIALEIGDCLWYVSMISDLFVRGDRLKTLEFDLPKLPMLQKVSSSKAIFDFRTDIQTAFILRADCFHNGDESMMLFHLASIAATFGLSLNECADAVLGKLSQRKEIGTIKGDGDGVSDRVSGDVSYHLDAASKMIQERQEKKRAESK